MKTNNFIGPNAKNLNFNLRVKRINSQGHLFGQITAVNKILSLKSNVCI